MQAEIPIFDVIKIEYGMIHIIGRKHSGKTTLIKDILKIKNVSHNGSAVIMCKDECNYKEYGLFVHNNFNKTIFDRLICIQESNHNTETRYLILDDVMDIDNINLINDVTYSGRCYNIITINTYDNCVYISNVSKNNTNYTFIFNDNFDDNSDDNFDEKNKLYNDYFYKFYLEYENFNNIFNTLKSYECFVIDHIKNELYLYKAKLELNLEIVLR